MKQFNNLLDALNYHTHCPLCQSELQSDKYTNSKQKILLEFLGNSIYIDTTSQDIEIVKDQSIADHPSCNGTLGQSMKIECNKCHMYSFVIQIWIDLTKLIINRIILNSEMVSWEGNRNILHEIVLLHSTNKTRYSYYNPNPNMDDGQVFLPLINIDVSNPKDAVERVRKLIVFS